MRTYFMGFLRRGPKWSKERPPEAQAAGEGHMANIKRLGACGKLLIAGPFKHPADAPDQGPLAGILLFDVATQEEAEALIRTDPAIIAGRFTPPSRCGGEERGAPPGRSRGGERGA